ncbi:hypothetical protein D3C71_1854180 [compost metagenome]
MYEHKIIIGVPEGEEPRVALSQRSGIHLKGFRFHLCLNQGYLNKPLIDRQAKQLQPLRQLVPVNLIPHPAQQHIVLEHGCRIL